MPGSKPKDGHQSRLGKYYYNERKRREGKLSPHLDHPYGPDRALAADIATTLRPLTEITFDGVTKELWPRDTAYEAAKKLFDAFDLDPDNPWNWRLLVMVFADILYDASPRGVVGRPRAKLDKLLHEAVAAHLEARPDVSSRDLARSIAKAKPKLVNKGARDGQIGLERRIKAVRNKS
jgi:hypothetical protein